MDSALRQEGQLEGGVMRDERSPPYRREHAPGYELHVEHGDAGAPAIELHQARLGAVRVEADLVGRLAAAPSSAGRIR